MDVDAVAPGGEGTVQAEVGARDGRAGAPGGASIGADTTAVGVSACSQAAAGRSGAAGGLSAPRGDRAHDGSCEGASAPRTSPGGGGGEARGGEAPAAIMESAGDGGGAASEAPKWLGVRQNRLRDGATVVSYELRLKLGRGSTYGGTHKDAALAARLHDELHVARSGDTNASRPNLEAALKAGCVARFPVLDPAAPVPWETATEAAKVAYEKLLADARRVGQERRVAGAFSGIPAAVAQRPAPKSQYKHVYSVGLQYAV